MRRRDAVIYGVAIALSLLAHASLFEGLGRAARNAPREKPRLLELAVLAPPPAAPEPAKPPPPPPPPKPVDLTKAPVLPSPEAPPPPNTTEKPPADAPPPRPTFGISMNSVVGPGTGSGFAVRVGNTLMKAPEKEFTRPAAVKAYAPVPYHLVTQIPRKLEECEAPPEAKRQGVEGKVKLEVEVLADGSVGEVKVTSSLTPEIDALVVEAIKRCRFAPAQMAGQAVATRIPYTYSFYREE